MTTRAATNDLAERNRRAFDYVISSLCRRRKRTTIIKRALALATLAALCGWLIY